MNSLPESSPSPWPFTRTSLRAGFPVGLAYGLAITLPGKFDAKGLPAWFILPFLAVIIVLGAYGTYHWCRWLAALDEMQRLVQLKAFALAIPTYLGIAVTGELLLRAGLPGFRLDGLQAVPAFVVLQFAAFLWFWWRAR